MKYFLGLIPTDVNADYAEYRVFKCEIEAKFVHPDIHDKHFEVKRPSECNKNGQFVDRQFSLF